MSVRTLSALFAAVLLFGGAIHAATAASEETKKVPPVEFTEAFMSEQANLDTGKEVWVEQCRHCHGKSAYPGKAPTLKPRKYTADFVYDRVSNGFRKIPGWAEVYSEHELKAVTAWILSNQFSP